MERVLNFFIYYLFLKEDEDSAVIGGAGRYDETAKRGAGGHGDRRAVRDVLQIHYVSGCLPLQIGYI